jgi:hypothetical protein
MHQLVTQNEEILARLERMQQQLTETAERLRDRFPSDDEVSAAVDAFLEGAAG